ncbi:alpha-xenorhabdolysin family binary toxin subunit B [Pseudomonas sp. KU43P]|uniref:alpha-xenorhabdolysin family binary toxin subunit B n=1 Tax=Pseudomonas sp. KU43P TaxID=2487887 RepID=UPI0012A897F2|nr:alpha-xenorhabdolysin family binary toxin subunit B [Pseudomonas sp. KU43P]BBH47780.1 hypothetical protein KU43P_42570 [Pseudomonas sp. KU43P]
MTSNVSYLPNGKLPDVQAMNTAASEFLNAFQQQKFAFQPTLHDVIKRYAIFLDDNQSAVRVALKALLTQLSDDSLQLVIEGLQSGDDPDLLDVAHEMRDDVLNALAGVINCLKTGNDGFASLPTLDGRAEGSRLEKSEKGLHGDIAQLSKLLEDEKKKRAALSAAIEALEAKDVQLDLSGLVPTSEQLSALVVPGGEAKFALDAATKAMKDLEKMMGSILEGMRYSELQDCRREAIKREKDLERQVRDKSMELQEVEGQQKMLKVIPELLGYAASWTSCVQAIVRSQGKQSAELKGASVRSLEDIKKLDVVFAEVRTYNKGLLDLMSKV